MSALLAGDANYLREVREQYENYPYPPRSPDTECEGLRCSAMWALDVMNYYGFGGRKDFTKGFRALVAGGGTGDATLALAEQLKDIGGSVVQLDISGASLQIAKDRSAARGLSNITWIHGSLLDAERLCQEKFDYIDCVGVLHHLESPSKGLEALTAVLKDDGVMGLLLYAKYAREAIYQMRSLMQLINDGEPDMRVKVEHCKRMLAQLPETNNFMHVAPLLPEIEWLKQPGIGGEAGIYDLLLHSHDVAYSVPELYDFITPQALHLLHLFFDSNVREGNDLYKPESYVQDPELRAVFNKMPLVPRQAAAELLHGKIFKHAFYVSKTYSLPPDITDLDMIPSYLLMIEESVYGHMAESLERLTVGSMVNYTFERIQVDFVNTPHLHYIARQMDGKKSLREICTAAHEDAGPSAPSFDTLVQEAQTFFAAFNRKDLMFLRHPSVPPFKTTASIHRATFK